MVTQAIEEYAGHSHLLVYGFQWSEKLLTTGYNCVRIKLTTPRYGCKLWDMSVIIATGDGHDQEQDSE